MTDPRRYPRSLDVQDADLGDMIERFLRRRLAADPAHVAKLLRQKRVTLVDGEGQERPLVRGEKIASPGTVVVAASRGRADPQPNRKMFIRVLHEDEHLAVVDKPAGIAMHPGPRVSGDCLLNGLVARWPELIPLGRERDYGLVHRLDRDTSGCLVVARTAEAYDAMVARFAHRRVHKRYIAFVDGRGIEQSFDVVDRKIEGQEARTEFRFEEWAGPIGRLVAKPITGRTHQVRIHLSWMHVPVLHDDRYGAGADDLTAGIYLKRLALHAESIEFRHPIEGEPLSVRRELPRDLKHSWRRAQHLYLGGAI